jgi:hypothetical protein
MRDGTVLERSGRRYRASTIRGYARDVESVLARSNGYMPTG